MADDLQAMAERSARELAALRRLVLIVLVVAIAALFVAMWQIQELARVRTQVGRLQTALTIEADRRLQAMTPQLEERAQRIEGSADRADKAVQGLDAKIDAAGDRIADRAVQRVEQELPALIDRYLESRLRR
jgi:uncharacterized protein HemX